MRRCVCHVCVCVYPARLGYFRERGLMRFDAHWLAARGEGPSSTYVCVMCVMRVYLLHRVCVYPALLITKATGTLHVDDTSTSSKGGGVELGRDSRRRFGDRHSAAFR